MIRASPEFDEHEEWLPEENHGLPDAFRVGSYAGIFRRMWHEYEPGFFEIVVTGRQDKLPIELLIEEAEEHIRTGCITGLANTSVE